MSAPAWMSLYVSDYLADTGHLSTVEHGAYMLLIMHYWQNEGLPTEDMKLARVCRLTAPEWQEIRDTLSDLFDEGWKHKRIDKELAVARETMSKRRAAGKAGASARYGKRIASACDDDAAAIASAEQSHTQKGVGLGNNSNLEKEASTREGDLDRIESELREAAGLANDPSPSLFDTSPIHALLKAGYDLRKDILPPIRAAKAAGSHATNWAYYAKIVESKKHKNDKLKPAPVVASVATEWVTDDDPRWPGLAAKHLAETGKPIKAMGSRHHPGMGHSFRSDWLEGQEKAA